MESEDEDIIKKETSSYGGTENVPEDEELDLNSVYELIGLGPTQYLYWTTVVLASFNTNCAFSTLSVTLPSLRCEWDLSSTFEAALATLPLVAFGVSSAIFGKISDMYGRKPVLIWVYVLTFLMVVINAASPSKWFFLMTRLTLGAVNGVGFSPSVCYGVEFAQNKYKEYGIIFHLAALEGGLVAVNGMALLLLLAVGWRWFMVIMILPVLPTLVLLIILPGSPRYLSVSGQQEKAMQSIRFMAKLNRAPLPENIRVICYENTELGSYSELLTTSHRSSVRSLSMMVSSALFIEFGLTLFLPLLFSSDFCGAKTKLPGHGCVILRQKDLFKLTITDIFGFCGTFLALLLAVRVGRLLPLRVGYAVVTLTIAALCVCLNWTVTFATAVAAKAVLGFVTGIIWIIMPESFPTNIRSTALGFIMATGKIGAALGNGCVYLIFFAQPLALVGVFFIVSVLGFVGTFVHNRETKDVVLQET